MIAADPRTDLFNPNAIRASQGTIFALPVAAGSIGGRSAPGSARRASGSWRPASTRALRYTDADLRGPVAIVLGSEATGSPRPGRETTSSAVRLPMLGVADSLNVSIAAAVLLYEARRQRDLGRAD